MKKFQKILIFSLLFLNLLVFSSYATIYTYNDIYANWPGWFIDPRDEIGVPEISNIQGVTVTIENNYLSSVVIQMDSPYRIPWDSSANTFDALFINNNWDGTYDNYQSWDYYVRDDTQDNNNDGALYSVTSGYTYILAPSISGTNLRTGHPAGIVDSYLTPVSGILNSVIWDGTNTLTYTFNPGIQMGDKFVIGWSVWCANDVFVTPVPEPGLLILLGIGIMGVGILARRYRKV